jgi:hypothetical protein
MTLLNYRLVVSIALALGGKAYRSTFEDGLVRLHVFRARCIIHDRLNLKISCCMVCLRIQEAQLTLFSISFLAALETSF